MITVILHCYQAIIYSSFINASQEFYSQDSDNPLQAPNSVLQPFIHCSCSSCKCKARGWVKIKFCHDSQEFRESARKEMHV